MGKVDKRPCTSARLMCSVENQNCCAIDSVSKSGNRTYRASFYPLLDRGEWATPLSLLVLVQMPSGRLIGRTVVEGRKCLQWERVLCGYGVRVGYLQVDQRAADDILSLIAKSRIGVSRYRSTLPSTETRVRVGQQRIRRAIDAPNGTTSHRTHVYSACTQTPTT